jgi:uncharacterized membrane protein
MKINWKRKLASRKLWCAVAGFATAVMVVLGIDELTIAQVAGLMTAASVLIAYIIGEGVADCKKRSNYNGGGSRHENK